jgi:hypothetical protein
MLCPCIRLATIGKIDIAGDLVDVHAICETQRRTTGLCRENRRLSTVGPDTHQTHIRVGNVEVAGVVVEPQPKRTATGALCGDRRELSDIVTLVLDVARTVGEGLPPGSFAIILEDAAI